jgi:hypothetical protein
MSVTIWDIPKQYLCNDRFIPDSDSYYDLIFDTAIDYRETEKIDHAPYDGVPIQNPS